MNKPLLKKRHAREARFRTYGFTAVALAFIFLAFLMLSIAKQGYSAFITTNINLEITFSPEILDPEKTGDMVAIMTGNFNSLIQQALRKKFPEATERKDLSNLYSLVSGDAEITLKQALEKDNSLLGKTIPMWLSSSSETNLFFKGKIKEETPEENRRLNNKQLSWLKQLESTGTIEKRFNRSFFTNADSRSPEQAGILGAVAGSIFTIIVCMSVAFPLGVMTALYLEEFARKNLLTDIIEVNINNLAAVPSIVFGLLGLTIFIQTFGMPRSSALVGGLTLSLLILPTIVITTRNSIKTVPQSIKDAAIALGASPLQVAFHHTIPLAMPGIMTGTILGIARALGETAPLLMIGMVAFVADIPGNFLNPATALPVQVFLWSDSPEAGFAEKTSAAILILLAFLIILNSLAAYIRKKFEVKW